MDATALGSYSSQGLMVIALSSVTITRLAIVRGNKHHAVMAVPGLWINRAHIFSISPTGISGNICIHRTVFRSLATNLAALYAYLEI